MLSEIAIDDPKAFTQLVKQAKGALEGKVVKAETKKEEVKTDVKEKASKKEDSKDFSKMTVAELKAVAKEKGIAGYTTMKKADLIDALK